MLFIRPLTEIAMCGVGKNVDIIRKSVENIKQAIDKDGILQTNLKKSNLSPYPTAYADVVLEPNRKQKYALECDLTFWAVQFLNLIENCSNF